MVSCEWDVFDGKFVFLARKRRCSEWCSLVIHWDPVVLSVLECFSTFMLRHLPMWEWSVETSSFCVCFPCTVYNFPIKLLILWFYICKTAGWEHDAVWTAAARCPWLPKRYQRLDEANSSQHIAIRLKTHQKFNSEFTTSLPTNGWFSWSFLVVNVHWFLLLNLSSSTPSSQFDGCTGIVNQQSFQFSGTRIFAFAPIRFMWDPKSEPKLRTSRGSLHCWG